jgi:hypothetical protein
MMLLNSVSQVARITSENHHSRPINIQYLKKKKKKKKKKTRVEKISGPCSL